MCTNASPSLLLSSSHSPTRISQVIQCAIASRLFVFILSFLIGLLQVTDYDTSSQIASSVDIDPKPGDKLVQALFGRFVKWDSIYFVRIAERGYEYEQFYAFFPFYPMLVRCLAKGIQYMVGWWISERWLIIVSGVLVSNVSFVLSAIELYKLGCAVMRDETVAFISSILYTINPASIFMSAVYTESTFALFAFTALHLLTNRHLFLSSVFFFLCTATRSNGSLLTGFIIFRCFYVFWHKFFAFFATLPPKLYKYLSGTAALRQSTNSHSTSEQFWNTIRSECTLPQDSTKATDINDSRFRTRLTFMTVMCLCALAPMGLFQFYGTSQFCTDEGSIDTRPYCKHWVFPSLYGYVQTFYWNQGLFHYYERKQIPNFILAAPMIILSIFGIYTYFCNRIGHIRRLYDNPKFKADISTKLTYNNSNNTTNNNTNTSFNNNINNNSNNNNNNQKRLQDIEFIRVINKDQVGYLGPHLLPYVLYWAIILLVSVTCMHVQVITRFFSSCPAVYWFCGHVFFHKHNYTTAKKAILCYFLFYLLVGTALFGLYYPWT